MNAAVRWMVTRPGSPLAPAEFDPFSPAPDEVIVEIAGIRTKNDLPLTLGHENTGRIVAGPESLRS
jgi:6-hydroxycyclohex-1-ene-1-carbonyl-CoA dehydrogenase